MRFYQVKTKRQRKIRTIRILLAFILLIFLSSSALAAQKTFIRDYTYEASELDDKISCQYIALEQVKRLLLEELGSYLESSSTVKNYQLDHEQITTLTAGIVQTKILQESWDGKTYWMKARLSADSDEVAEAIARMKDNRQIVNDLQEARREAFDAMAEVERLKSALAKAEASPEQKSRYDESIRRLQTTDLLERGQSYIVAGEYEEAVETYNQIIAIRPADAKGYSNLATAYLFLGNYQRAVTNLNRAVKLSAGNQPLVQNRNIAYKLLKAPHQVTPRERNFLPRQEAVRVQHTYRPQTQAPAPPHRHVGSMKQERPPMMQQPHQRVQMSYRPAVRQQHRQEVMHRQQAQVSVKHPAFMRQVKTGGNQGAKRHKP